MGALITGVAGLIGSRFAKHLIDKGISVIGIDDLSGGYLENIPSGVSFHQWSCHDNISYIFERYKIDVVFHFSAYAAEGLSPFMRKFNYNNNLIATANIVNHCINHNVKKLVFTSSMAVYGNGLVPFSEKDNCVPADPYGVAKLSCEYDIQIAGEQHGLEWCIIRPHNVYGPGQNIWDKYRNVLGIWMNQHLNHKPLTIFGFGDQTRSFSYIDDILEPLFNAININNEIINLGGIQKTTILKAAETLIEVMDGGKIEFLEPRHEVKLAYSTHQKSIDLLGFKDQTDLKTGLTAMWEWAKKQPKRESFKWQEYEINKGMYDYWK